MGLNLGFILPLLCIGRRLKGLSFPHGERAAQVLCRIPSSFAKAGLSQCSVLPLPGNEVFLSACYSAFVYQGQRSFNAPGPPAGLQAAGPEAVNSRNSFAALKETASVQAPQCVQRVLYKRAPASPGRWCRPRPALGGRAARAAQAEFTPGVKRHAHRAGLAPCTACSELTGLCSTRAKERSQAEFTPGVSKARVVQALRPHNESRTDGPSRSSAFACKTQTKSPPVFGGPFVDARGAQRGVGRRVRKTTLRWRATTPDSGRPEPSWWSARKCPPYSSGPGAAQRFLSWKAGLPPC